MRAPTRPISHTEYCRARLAVRAMTGNQALATPEERFILHLVPAPSDCWGWNGAKNAGYGAFRVAERTVSAHRWAFEKWRNEIPEGLHLDHLCRNPSCVNPWHLEPVTASVNTKRALAWITHCPQGHAYDSENTEIRKVGKYDRRRCRSCHRIESSTRYHASRSIPSS